MKKISTRLECMANNLKDKNCNVCYIIDETDKITAMLFWKKDDMDKNKYAKIYHAYDDKQMSFIEFGYPYIQFFQDGEIAQPFSLPYCWGQEHPTKDFPENFILDVDESHIDEINMTKIENKYLHKQKILPMGIYMPMDILQKYLMEHLAKNNMKLLNEPDVLFLDNKINYPCLSPL